MGLSLGISRVAAPGDIVRQEGDDNEYVVRTEDSINGTATVENRNTGETKEVELESLEVDSAKTAEYRALLAMSDRIYKAALPTPSCMGIVKQALTEFEIPFNEKNNEIIYRLSGSDTESLNKEDIVHYTINNLGGKYSSVRVGETTPNKEVKTLDDVKMEVEDFNNNNKIEAPDLQKEEPKEEPEEEEKVEELIPTKDNSKETPLQKLIEESPEMQERLVQELVNSIGASRKLAVLFEKEDIEISESNLMATLQNVSAFILKHR